MAFYTLDDRQPVMAAAGIGYAPGVMDIYSRQFALRPRASFTGFGAVDFDATSVWADWVAGSKGNNAAGMRAADAIRAALMQIGFGQMPLGRPWAYPEGSAAASQDKAAYSSFATKFNVPPMIGKPSWWPSQPGILKLGELAAANVPVGGKLPIETHVVNGVVVQGASPESIKAASAKASAARMGAAVVLVAAGLIGLAYYSKKKRGSGMSTTAVANRRRRRHRRGRR